MHEGLDVVAGILGGHEAVVGILHALVDIPAYGLEGGAALPELPEVAAGLAAVGGGDGLGAHAQQPLGEGAGVGERRGILRDGKPGDEEGTELRVAAARGLIFAMEEIAGAVGRRLEDDHRERAQEHPRACRTKELLGGLLFGGLPDADLGAMHEVVVAAAA